jgi:hypothetical protein
MMGVLESKLTAKMCEYFKVDVEKDALAMRAFGAAKGRAVTAVV